MKQNFKIIFAFTTLFFVVSQVNILVAQDKSLKKDHSEVITRGSTSSITEKIPTLYVVDGVIQADSAAVMSKISPSQIESVTIFKGEKAVSLYGSRGVNGVVYIILKKDEKIIEEQEEEIKEIEETLVNIFPNPTSELVNVTLYLKEKSEVEIIMYNLQTLEKHEISKEMYEAGEQQINWKVNSLENGTYNVKIKIGKQIITKKLVIRN